MLRQTLNPQRMRAGRTGFTLLEMLVVLFIISLLLVLLVPALGGARSAAVNATCMSNEKQVGAAIAHYAVDYAGIIPFGPESRPSSVQDFYPMDGMVTSQLSLLSDGAAVGAGLLLDGYLQSKPQVLFCPGADRPLDADAELAKVGVTQAVASYTYRHGSNVLDVPMSSPDTWTDHIRLDDLGVNSNGDPIRALLQDHNFLVATESPAFGVVNRTNHNQQRVNTLYADGHVRSLDNSTGRYTASVGNALHLGPKRMLRGLERADID